MLLSFLASIYCKKVCLGVWVCGCVRVGVRVKTSVYNAIIQDIYLTL